MDQGNNRTGLHWALINKWLMEKLINTEGGLMPLDRQSLMKRSHAKLDYQIVLENASRTMIRFKKPERLIKMIVRVIDEEVRTSHTAVLLYKESKKAFVLIDSKGSEGVKIPVNFIRMGYDNPLIKLMDQRQNYLLSDTGTLSYSDLKTLHSNKDAFKNYPDLEEVVGLVLKQLDLLKAEICIPCYYKKRLIGVLILGAKLSHEKFSRQEIGFFMTLANDAAMAIANAELIQNLQDKVNEINVLFEREHHLFLSMVIALATAVDAKDAYTHGHTERVTRYCMAVADELEDIPEAMVYRKFRETLHIAALLHDIGKIGCPDKILGKRSKLTEQEIAKLKEHPVIGAAILSPVRELREIAHEIRCHQERYDGKGYPNGLKGIEIPLVARIIAVCDTFDAMTTNRPYRQSKTVENAIKEIRDGAGTQFDPIVASAFFLAYEKGKIILNSNTKLARPDDNLNEKTSVDAEKNDDEDED